MLMLLSQVDDDAAQAVGTSPRPHAANASEKGQAYRLLVPWTGWLPPPVLHTLKRAVRPLERERQRLARLPDYATGSTTLAGGPLTFVHPRSFINQYELIFERHQYDFPSATDAPRIVDGGANVGLACVYWKRRWPQASITAFEADPRICTVLRGNLRAAGADAGVDVVQAALSDRTGTLRFAQDGGDAGRLDPAGGTDVPALKLGPFLDEHVDLLKLDIEGAETDVLTDCADALSRVERVFVEYHSLAEQPQRLVELLGVLRRAGFRVHIQTEHCSANPFERIRTSYGMDLQLNVWAVRPS